MSSSEDTSSTSSSPNGNDPSDDELEREATELERLRSENEELRTENEELFGALKALDDWPDDPPAPPSVETPDKPTRLERWLGTGSRPYFAFSDRVFRWTWQVLAVASGSMVVFPWGAHRKIWTLIDASIRTVGVVATVAAAIALPRITQLVSEIRGSRED